MEPSTTQENTLEVEGKLLEFKMVSLNESTTTLNSLGVSILHKDATNANTTSVTFNLKGFCEIRQCKKWRFGEPLFELIKSLLLCCSPNERDIFLGQFVEGASNCRKVFDKTR